MKIKNHRLCQILQEKLDFQMHRYLDIQSAAVALVNHLELTHLNHHQQRQCILEVFEQAHLNSD